jgi:hypothetical protein
MTQIAQRRPDVEEGSNPQKEETHRFTTLGSRCTVYARTSLYSMK